MKPDTIATPDTSGFEELVPSRYALRIGEIDVLVVSDGVLPLPTTQDDNCSGPLGALPIGLPFR